MAGSGGHLQGGNRCGSGRERGGAGGRLAQLHVQRINITGNRDLKGGVTNGEPGANQTIPGSRRIPEGW